ncbi:MAG: DUF2147 domain-containing protein [Saprospiraceae bacterium]|nr:DUF2147 domain-containing protein [Saprospiraceae bacterium]
MKQLIKFTCFAFLLFTTTLVYGQHKITGVWKNIDDEDGKEKSHIEIYESKGMLRARVTKLLEGATVKTCGKCKGNNKDKPLEGMEILWDLKKVSDTEYEEGFILNPKNGKVYDCFISLEDKDKLKVRGYLGVSMFGKTQYWYRVR